MPSPIDAAQTGKFRRPALDLFKLWNRKGHYYLGLYFLFFLWLFTFTGLLLNHSWKFSEFWPNRKVSAFERQVQVFQAGNELDRARDVIRQLGIAGEIEWTASRPNSTLFDFRVNRPRHSFNVSVDANNGYAKVEETRINAWGVMRVLHTFSGMRSGDTRNHRDWILTTLWVFSMDAVAAGMVLMVLSGVYMWYGLPAKRKGGAGALVLGIATCGIFLFGLRWLYR